MLLTLNSGPPFEDALAAHRPYLLRFAQRRLRDAALVEDVVQETFLAALQGADRFEGKATLRTWLTGILLRRIADQVRRAKRASQPASSGDVAAHDIDGEPDYDRDDQAVEWRDPQRMLESRQSAAALGDCLDTLPAIAARALTLREIDGLTSAQIARELDVTTAYCAVLLHRARSRLRDCYAARFN